MKILTALLLGLMLTMSGCSKLTLENYNKIAMGMPYDEVVRLIGPPDRCDDVMACAAASGATKNIPSM